MKKEVLIVKRLESIKTLLELDDYDIVELQSQKLSDDGDSDLAEIISLCKRASEEKDKLIKLIDSYLYKPRGDTLTPHQKEVFDAIIQDFEIILSDNGAVSEHKNYVSLSGFAGVGKTFLTSKLIEYFIKKKEYKLLLTTPTHKSLSVAKYMLDNQNLQVPTMTLHSYLDVKLYTDYYLGTKSFKRDKIDLQADYEKNLDILIVDESSMVSNELLEFITENLEQNKLKSVLFIGDPYQLPPVDEGVNGVQGLPKTHYLTEVVRQAKDSYVKQIAIEIKECIRTKKYTPIVEILDLKKYPKLKVFYDLQDMYNDFCSKENWYDEKNIILSFTNNSVDEFNRVIRARYWTQKDVVPKEAIIDGETLVFNESYKIAFRNSEVVVVKSATKKLNHSIVIKNESDEVFALKYFECISEDGRSFNAIDPDHYKHFNSFLTNLASSAKNEKDNNKRKALWRKFFAIKDEYADLKYIHSSTIHKSQGSTFDNVYIDINPIIAYSKKDKEVAYKLLYVAITRASKDIKIIL